MPIHAVKAGSPWLRFDALRTLLSVLAVASRTCRHRSHAERPDCVLPSLMHRYAAGLVVVRGAAS